MFAKPFCGTYGSRREQAVITRNHGFDDRTGAKRVERRTVNACADPACARYTPDVPGSPGEYVELP